MTKQVYIGPTITGVAARNTVYDGLPDSLLAAIQAAPYLSGLCVPIQAMAAASSQIQRRRGGYYTLFAKAQRDAEKIQAELQKGE